MFNSKAPAFVVTLTVCALLSSCATQAPSADPNALPAGFKASVVMAHNAVQGSGPIGVTDRYTLDGKVVAYIAFSWTDSQQPWGPQKLEHRWYSGDRLVSKTEGEKNFPRAPHYVWATTQPVALGVGRAHYELYWHGIKLAERDFEIFDGTALLKAPPASPQSKAALM